MIRLSGFLLAFALSLAVYPASAQNGSSQQEESGVSLAVDVPAELLERWRAASGPVRFSTLLEELVEETQGRVSGEGLVDGAVEMRGLRMDQVRAAIFVQIGGETTRSESEMPFAISDAVGFEAEEPLSIESHIPRRKLEALVDFHAEAGEVEIVEATVREFGPAEVREGEIGIVITLVPAGEEISPFLGFAVHQQVMSPSLVLRLAPAERKHMPLTASQEEAFERAVRAELPETLPGGWVLASDPAPTSLSDGYALYEKEGASTPLRVAARPLDTFAEAWTRLEDQQSAETMTVEEATVYKAEQERDYFTMRTLTTYPRENLVVVVKGAAAYDELSDALRALPLEAFTEAADAL